VALDSAGNLIFADSTSDRICVVAAATGTFYGHAMSAGDIYTITGTGQPGFSGDGGPATSATLSTYRSAGVAMDGYGNVLVIDGSNDRIRMVAAAAPLSRRSSASPGASRLTNRGTSSSPTRRAHLRCASSLRPPALFTASR
jgi:hypothetical protein